MRKLIAAFKMSIDAKIEGPDGFADWVSEWSDDYDLTEQIDACVLGSEMYRGYEPYWTGIQNEPEKSAWVTGAPPTAAEIAWGKFAKKTPHYVVSRTQQSAIWPNTYFLRGIDDIRKLKTNSGKDIYLMGGARLACACLDAGIVDELRLLVYPLVAGEGKPLFSTIAKRHKLMLRVAEQSTKGIMSVVYDVAM
jgi:dihydrofolate reductase